MVIVRGDGHGGFWCHKRHWEEGALEFAENELDAETIAAIRNDPTKTKGGAKRIELKDREAPEERPADTRRDSKKESPADRADRLLEETRRRLEDAESYASVEGFKAERIRTDALRERQDAEAEAERARADAARIRAESEAETKRILAEANRARAQAEEAKAKAEAETTNPKPPAARGTNPKPPAG
jgi:hypothetical protein